MRLQLARSCACLLLLSAAGFAAPPITVELATERGVQITAPHEWLQLLASIGVEDVRIRGMRIGDELQAENRGTAEQPRYHVLGFLTGRNQLRLPGGTFSHADRAALKDYFERLAADGAEALTAPRGRFGLTAKELAAVTADLAQPIDFETKGLPPNKVITKLLAKFAHPRIASDGHGFQLDTAAPFPDELRGLTAGTGLAIMLRNYGYVLQPDQRLGRPFAYFILTSNSARVLDSTMGDMEDAALKQWPIGWKPDRRASDIVPEMFEPRNAEIDGYTLEETLQAIGSRIKIPIYLDHAALRAERIDPATIQVRLPRMRASYKRIIDRVLFQARLYGQIRVDEVGTPFMWVTR